MRFAQSRTLARSQLSQVFPVALVPSRRRFWSALELVGVATIMAAFLAVAMF